MCCAGLPSQYHFQLYFFLPQFYNFSKAFCIWFMVIFVYRFCFMQCLKREKVVRVFKLNTGQDDHAIMFLDDYLKQVSFI